MKRNYLRVLYDTSPLLSEKDDIIRRVENCLREVAQFHARNQELEGEMSKAARRGKWRKSVSRKRCGGGLVSASVQTHHHSAAVICDSIPRSLAIICRNRIAGISRTNDGRR